MYPPVGTLLAEKYDPRLGARDRFTFANLWSNFVPSHQ